MITQDELYSYVIYIQKKQYCTAQQIFDHNLIINQMHV